MGDLLMKAGYLTLICSLIYFLPWFVAVGVALLLLGAAFDA